MLGNLIEPKSTIKDLTPEGCDGQRPAPPRGSKYTGRSSRGFDIGACCTGIS